MVPSPFVRRITCKQRDPRAPDFADSAMRSIRRPCTGSILPGERGPIDPRTGGWHTREVSEKPQRRGNSGSRKGVHPGVYREALELLRTPTIDDDTIAAEVARRLVSLAGRGRTSHRAVVAALEAESPCGVLQELGRMAGQDEDATPDRLLRLAQGRSCEARRRSNPIACNEGFTCRHCGIEVLPASGGFQRNHCPECLHSLHVDVVPGDRQNDCEGLMEPQEVEQAGSDQLWIHHRCLRCGAVQRVRAAVGRTTQPDSTRALRALSARSGN